MTLLLNNAQCDTGVENINPEYCEIHAKIDGCIEVPASKEFTDAELQSLEATITSLVKADKKSDRFYPYPTLTKFTSTGGDWKTETAASGQIIPTIVEQYKFEFEYYTGGLSVSNAIASRNPSTRSYLFYNDEYLIGTRSITGKFMGIPSYLIPGAAKYGGQDQAPKYMFSLSVLPVYLNKKVAVLSLGDLSPQTLKGLKDINVTVKTPLTTSGVVVVNARSKSNNTDYISEYSTVYSAASIVTFKNANGVTIPTIANLVTGSDLTVTLDTTNAAYTSAAVGSTITMFIGPVSALETAGIVGAEFSSVSLKKV